jgi:hypothetical protein
LVLAGSIWHQAPLPARGDENFYVSQAQALRDTGVFASLAEGNPLGFTFPMMLIAATGVSLLTAGRLISLLSIPAIIAGQLHLARKLFGVTPRGMHLVVLFSLQVVIGTLYAFWAIADLLFTAVLLWTLIVLWTAVTNPGSLRRSLLAGLMLGAALLVRPLALLYLPGLLLAIVWRLRSVDAPLRPAAWRAAALAACAATTVLVLQQLPSLSRSGVLRFEDKNPAAGANWVQRLALSQLRREEGALARGQHVKWDDVNTFLAANGPDSLPRSFLDRMFWNPAFFARGLADGLFRTTAYILWRRSGCLFVLALVPILSRKPLRDRSGALRFFSTIAFSYALSLALVSLSDIDTRYLFLTQLVSIGAGVAVLERLSEGHRRLASGLVGTQFLLLLASLSFDAHTLISRLH